MKFSELNLHPGVIAGVEAQGFTDCTPIQTASIPLILDGKDVAGLAQTGTGKTAAYLIPIIDRILRSQDGEESDEKLKLRLINDWKPSNFILVLVPTRELAEQVHEQVEVIGGPCNMTSVAIYGGMSYQPQKSAINRGVNFIIATPGRLIDLYKEHVVDLNQVRAVVFDEADRMFDMGFKDDMKYLLKRIPRDRQFMVYSATLNFDVLNVAYEFGSHPVEVNVSRDQAKADNVKDYLFHVSTHEKGQYLLSLLKKHQPRQAIIFSNFKSNVERVAQFLSSNGIPAMGISSLLTQSQRNRVMDQFRKEGNDRNILVATDVAARGLDIKGVDIVFNYELPDDPENYVHRIGRTGRAGEKGLALSLSSDRDVDAMTRIKTFVDHEIETGWLDDEDIVKEYKELPREQRRDYKKTSSGGRDSRGGRDRNRNKDRDTRGGRDRNRNKDRDRDRNRNRDRHRDAKPESSENKDGETRKTEGGRGQHRDRVTGRHRSRNNRNKKSSDDKTQNRDERSTKSGGKENRQRKTGGKRYKKVYKHKPRDQRFDPSKSKDKSSSSTNQKSGVGKVAGFIKKLFS